MNCANLPSVTSSPASVSGAWLCDLRGGPTKDRYGPDHALANLSPQLASLVGSMTSGTYGPTGTTSSASAALQSSLASRLQARTASVGSTLYTLTWKERVTPSGRSISALRASGRRTSVKDSGSSEKTGWPTPVQQDSQSSARTTTADEKWKGNGRMANCHTLLDAGRLAAWVTPTTRDWKDSGADIVPRGDNGKERFDQLPRQANLAGWGTPLTNHANGEPEAFLERKRRSMERGSQSMGLSISDLNMQVKAWLRYPPKDAAAGWPTPNATDHIERQGMRPSRAATGRTTGYLSEAVKTYAEPIGALAGWPTPNTMTGGQTSRGGNRKDEPLMGGILRGLADHPQPARLTATGELLIGSSAGMGNGGQLDPDHSLWLMGLPAAWADCAPTATQSSRKSRQK